MHALHPNERQLPSPGQAMLSATMTVMTSANVNLFEGHIRSIILTPLHYQDDCGMH